MIRVSVWLVSCYAHVFVLLQIVIVTHRPARRIVWSCLKCRFCEPADARLAAPNVTSGCNCHAPNTDVVETGKLVEATYCSTETFNARCAPNYVVHITHATYGRVKVDRCIEELVGVICYVNITSVLRNHCAERRTCQFGVLDQFLLSLDSCPSGLKSQLYAGYRCIPGVFQQTAPH